KSLFNQLERKAELGGEGVDQVPEAVVGGRDVPEQQEQRPEPPSAHAVQPLAEREAQVRSEHSVPIQRRDREQGKNNPGNLEQAEERNRRPGAALTCDPEAKRHGEKECQESIGEGSSQRDRAVPPAIPQTPVLDIHRASRQPQAAEE